MNQKKTQNVNREKQIGAKETQNTPKSQNDISIEIKKYTQETQNDARETQSISKRYKMVTKKLKRTLDWHKNNTQEIKNGARERKRKQRDNKNTTKTQKSAPAYVSMLEVWSWHVFHLKSWT